MTTLLMRGLGVLAALGCVQSAVAQLDTVAEIDILDFSIASIQREPLVCPNGRRVELPPGFEKLNWSHWYMFSADVVRVISGELDQPRVSFASNQALNFQCVTLSPLPDGAIGERLRELGVSYEAQAYSCGDFRPSCGTFPGTSINMCDWGEWKLQIEPPTAQPRPEPKQPNLTLIARFLETRPFTLAERMADLPADVRAVLPRWDDGTFSIAERGEPWNSTDIATDCNPQKGAQHWVSGVSENLAVVLHRSGGLGVSSNVALIDRDTGEAISCAITWDALRAWNGSNHARSMFVGWRDDPSTPQCLHWRDAR